MVVANRESAQPEEVVLDECTGWIINPPMIQQWVPAHAGIPLIYVVWFDLSDQMVPTGGDGVSEVGVTQVAGAIANAVLDTRHRRLRDLPCTPDEVLVR